MLEDHFNCRYFGPFPSPFKQEKFVAGAYVCILYSTSIVAPPVKLLLNLEWS